MTEETLRESADGLQEREQVSPDRPPIHNGLGLHDFVLSEFAPETGRCDRCGGGPLAEVHQKPVDQTARIADALEEIADVLHRIEDRMSDCEKGVWVNMG